jgi:hypothetical protein
MVCVTIIVHKCLMSAFMFKKIIHGVFLRILILFMNHGFKFNIESIVSLFNLQRNSHVGYKHHVQAYATNGWFNNKTIDLSWSIKPWKFAIIKHDEVQAANVLVSPNPTSSDQPLVN